MLLFAKRHQILRVTPACVPLAGKVTTQELEKPGLLNKVVRYQINMEGPRLLRPAHHQEHGPCIGAANWHDLESFVHFHVFGAPQWLEESSLSLKP